MSIKIILTDDHTLLRSGIRTLLSRQSDFEIIGEAANGFTGIKLVEQMHLDIVLLDLDMSVMNNRGTLAQMLSNNPQQTVVMLTIPEDNDNLTECMRVGTHDFLLKDIDTGFLLDGIRKAVNSDNVFSPEMTTRPV